MVITKREREREQIRTRIAELEAIANRTPEQEQELRDLKEKLTKLEQQDKGKSYWPWIIGGGIFVVLSIIVIYFLIRNKKKIK